MKEYIVKIKPLTPIWTGDAERKGTTLRETGIIGSLRWWYEALIRGLGGTACDPTKTECKDKNRCVVCELFGCTGWARKFLLHIETLQNNYAPFVIVKPNGSKKPYLLGDYDRDGGNYKEKGGLVGEYKLTFIVDDTYFDVIKLLLRLSTEWGIGAGVQKGFGIAYIDDDFKVSNVEIAIKQNKVKKSDSGLLPSIDQIFFYKVPFKKESIKEIREIIKHNTYKTIGDLRRNEPLNIDFSSYTYIPSSPWVRKAIRRLFHDNDVLRHFIMGFVSIKGTTKPIHLDCWKHSIEDENNKTRYYCLTCRRGNIDENGILEKTGSKIFVSHIYNKNAFLKDGEEKWEMKIWGWIPRIPDKIGVKRENIIKTIQSNIIYEDFWKSVFGLEECPVETNSIVEKLNVEPKEVLKDGGGII